MTPSPQWGTSTNTQDAEHSRAVEQDGMFAGIEDDADTDAAE